jgi:hypothetical protein
MARCVPIGRKLKLTEHQATEAIARRNAGESLTEIALSYREPFDDFEALNQRP